MTFDMRLTKTKQARTQALKKCRKRKKGKYPEYYLCTIFSKLDCVNPKGVIVPDATTDCKIVRDALEAIMIWQYKDGVKYGRGK